METLKKGSKGEDVKTLQKALGITADGDFGAKTEAAVKAFQTKNGLTADGIVGPKTWAMITGSTVTAKTVVAETKTATTTTANSKCVDSSVVYKPITVHITKSAGRKIKYLVIHYTAGSTSKEGTALSTRNVFLKREASADFVVDDKSMVQINPDLNNYYCWAVGDKGDGRKKTIFNKDCISIEVCSSLKKGTSASKPNHTGWYFTDAVLDNAEKLSKILMKKFNIDIDHVVRHNDVSGKMCPGLVGWNTGKLYKEDGTATKEKNNESEWIKFKNRLK